MRQGTTRVVGVPLMLAILVLGARHAPGQAAPGHAPLPDERLGIRTAPLLLLSRPDVRADLGLTARQASLAERAITDLYVRASAIRGKTGTEAIEERKAVDEAQRRALTTILSPDQYNRLVQIDLQWEGPSALDSRPVVADTLGLTPEQRAALKQAVARRDERRAHGTYSRADERSLARATLSVLTPPQQERWKAMLGREFIPRVASGSTKRPR